MTITRLSANPILSPDPNHDWEAIASFNGCPIQTKSKTFILYRAISKSQQTEQHHFERSIIGIAETKESIQILNRKPFIEPSERWDRYGCEDPRVTKIGSNYYICYTGLGTYPFTPAGITVGIVKTKNFKSIEKHHATFFNSKAMTLFPERINGKIVALLSINTDMPPTNIAIAMFNRESDMWSRDYWEEWYSNFGLHTISLQRSRNDHVEIGTPPIKTAKGWLMFYSYIRNYASQDKIFGIEAALMDLQNPQQCIGRITEPLLVPERDYECHGLVANITFPTGLLLDGDTLSLYYGAADTHTCIATCSLQEILAKFP